MKFDLRNSVDRILGKRSATPRDAVLQTCSENRVANYKSEIYEDHLQIHPKTSRRQLFWDPYCYY